MPAYGATTIPAQLPALDGWVAPDERIVRNNGAELTLDDGTVLEAGDIAVVDLSDRVAAVEAMFGRLEVNPDTSKARVAPRSRSSVGTLVGPDVDVTAGVELR